MICRDNVPGLLLTLKLGADCIGWMCLLLQLRKCKPFWLDLLWDLDVLVPLQQTCSLPLSEKKCFERDRLVQNLVELFFFSQLVVFVITKANETWNKMLDYDHFDQHQTQFIRTYVCFSVENCYRCLPGVVACLPLGNISHLDLLLRWTTPLAYRELHDIVVHTDCLPTADLEKVIERSPEIRCGIKFIY